MYMMDWMTSLAQQCYNSFVLFDSHYKYRFNHHELSWNEAIGIGLSMLQCQGMSAKVSVNVSPIFWGKVSILVSAILSPESISIDIGDNF